jgi:hypothetical protein
MLAQNCEDVAVLSHRELQPVGFWVNRYSLAIQWPGNQHGLFGFSEC